MSIAPKVLYVITKATWGGAQRYVYDLAKEAQGAGYAISVAYGTPGKLSEMLEEDGIATISLPSLGRDVRIGSDGKTFLELIRLFKKEKPDVVHLNSSKIGALGALAAKIARVPKVIFTAHGWAFNEERSAIQKGIIYFLSWLTMLCADTVIVVSDKTHDQAPHFLVKEKIVTIHNSIKQVPLYSKMSARGILKLPPFSRKDVVIGTIGELHKNKGQTYLLESFASINQEFPHTHLLIIGGGEEEAKLKNKAETLGISDKVIFTGFVPEGAQYIRAIDMFVLPSITEAFGYVLLEAGVAGLPSIATRVGGIPEIIENNTHGLLVSPRDVKELTLAMKFLLEHKDRRLEYAAKLHEKVLKEFSFEAMCEKTFALYGLLKS